MDVQWKDPKSLLIRCPDSVVRTTPLERIATATAGQLKQLDPAVLSLTVNSLVYLRDLTHLPPDLQHLEIGCADLVTDEGLDQLGRCVNQLRHLKTFRVGCRSVQTCSNEAVAKLARQVPDGVETLELKLWISISRLTRLPGSLQHLTLFAFEDRGHPPDCTRFLMAYGERRGSFRLKAPEIDADSRDALTRAIPRIEINGLRVRKRRRCTL